MDLITTHMNADFDALGSIVAAKKLYPDSRLLLPGSQEEAVREFMLLAKGLVAVESEKECRFDDIDRLILVDTRHRPRIGAAAALAEKVSEVHIYDHHPRMKGDIVADKDVYEAVGATVTILADIIRRKRIRLSHLEATMMLLGIYEETGSLTYRTTTKLDVDMVSFLLSQGADLSMVSNCLNRELSEKELSLLTLLINLTRRVLIKGVSVSMIELDGESYVGELGVVMHKLLEVENIPVLFVFIKTSAGRIDIIARSNIAAVDVNKVLSRFGGGGHPTAAGAKIRGGDIDSVKEKLIRVLKSSIKVRVYARDIMSRAWKSLDADTEICDAKEIMTREKAEAMPVMDKEKLVGMMTTSGLEKAMKRYSGHSKVKAWMSRDVVTVKPDTPLHLLERMVLDKKAGVLPVMKARRMAGVITRTDILKNVHGGLFLKAPGRIKGAVTSNIAKKMERLLPKETITLLRKIGAAANSLGYSAFIVGGLVRDALLGLRNLDLDIVVEGEAIKLAHILSKQLRCALIIHKRFGTCSLITKDRLKIDLATARKEIYEKPAALPTVEFSSLKNDLVRRDFTINAMAASIRHANFGQLIDFFGGERDLERGCIRVMHDGSFIDDPTRIFRAVRFEQRFAFTIDAHTQMLIRDAVRVEMFEKVHPHRVRDEIILILKEREPIRSLRRMEELHELRFIHQKIRFTARSEKFYGAIDKVCDWHDSSGFKKRPVERWLMYLAALFEDLKYGEAVSVCDKFVFRRGETMRILSYKKHGGSIARALAIDSCMKPSRIYRMLEPLSYEVILLIMAKSGSARARSRIKDFFREYNGMRVHIRGRDLTLLGLKPSPHFSGILRKVLYAKADGKLKTKDEEMAYAKRLIGRLRQQAPAH